MSQEARIHDLDPRFFAAIVRAPQLLRYWLGSEVVDLGLDPKRFAAHPSVVELAGPEGLGRVRSTDDGVDLAWHLEAILFVLPRAYPDESDAWAALAGGSSTEFPVHALGSSIAIAPHVVRRIAGLLAVLSAVALGHAINFAELATAKIYPQMWDEPAEQAGFRVAYRAFERALDRAARRGHAILIDWTL